MKVLVFFDSCYTFFILFIFILYIFISLLFFTCNSAFGQGHLEPWRYKNAFIIIIIIIIITCYNYIIFIAGYIYFRYGLSYGVT